MLGRARASASNNNSAAQGQQQPMPQPHLPPVGALPQLDEPQRGKLQMLGLLPHDQVQHDRHRDASAPPRNATCRKVIQYLARRLARYSVSARSNCMLVSSGT